MNYKLHPQYHTASVRCTTCGNEFEIGSTKKELVVDTCSNCHPFYTGKQKHVAQAGRVDKFNRKYGFTTDNQE